MPTPRPRQTCVFGLGVLVASWVVAGATAFVVGSAIAKRVLR